MKQGLMEKFNLSFLLLLFIATLEAEGTKSALVKNPRQVSAGPDSVCVIDDEGAKCLLEIRSWDNGQRSKSLVFQKVNHLTNPRQVSLGKYLCVLDDEGVKCWDDYLVKNALEGQPWHFPELKNPRQVSAGDMYTCVLDEEDVKCWDYRERLVRPFKNLKNPQNVSTKDFMICVQDDEGVKCSDNDGKVFNTRESYYNVITNRTSKSHLVSLGLKFFCELDSQGPKCSGGPEGIDITPPAGLKNPSQLSVGLLHVCAISDPGIVTCWGSNNDGQLNVPLLESPRQLSSGDRFTCALDGQNVKCWGGGLIQKFRGFTTSRKTPEAYFNNLHSNFTPVRKAYSRILKDLVQKQTSLQSWKNPESYLAFSLISPLILSGDSLVYRDELIPEFLAMEETLNSNFGYRDMKDGLAKTPDNSLTRRLALVTLHSSLSIASTFFRGSELTSIQNSLRSVNGAISDPMDNIKIHAVLKQMDNLPLKRLGSNSTGAFLLEATEKAKEWLALKTQI